VPGLVLWEKKNGKNGGLAGKKTLREGFKKDASDEKASGWRDLVSEGEKAKGIWLDAFVAKSTWAPRVNWKQTLSSSQLA